MTDRKPKYPRPQVNVRYFNADGTLTTEGFQLFDAFYRAIVDLDARVTALEP